MQTLLLINQFLTTLHHFDVLQRFLSDISEITTVHALKKALRPFVLVEYGWEES
jgi:hypothetical protein